MLQKSLRGINCSGELERNCSHADVLHLRCRRAARGCEDEIQRFNKRVYIHSSVLYIVSDLTGVDYKIPILAVPCSRHAYTFLRALNNLFP